MKKILLVFAVVAVSVSVTPAFAIKQLNDQFKVVYAGEKADPALKELVAEAKCNVCHVATEKSKKVRNPYGKALHEALEKEKFPMADFKKDPEKYAEQLKKIFVAVEKEKSADAEKRTFGERIQAKLLPGGDKDGK